MHDYLTLYKSNFFRLNLRVHHRVVWTYMDIMNMEHACVWWLNVIYNVSGWIEAFNKCVHVVHVYTKYMCTPSICVHQVHVCTKYMCTTGTFIFYILNSIFVHQVLVYTQYWNKCTDIIESTQTILTMYTCTLMISAALVSFLLFPWALQFYTDPKSRRPDGGYPGVGPWI